MAILLFLFWDRLGGWVPAPRRSERERQDMGCPSVEEVFYCVGDHGDGEGWRRVRRVECFKVLLDQVGRKGVEKDGASFGIGDGLFPKEFEMIEGGER